MRISILAISTLLVCGTLAAQQPRETFAARLQGGLLYSLHSADFAGNGDIIDCGQLSSGSGLNGVVQAIIEFPLSSSLGIGVGIGYAGRSATLNRENTYPIRDSQTGAESTMNTDLDLDATLSFLEIQPDVRFALIGDYAKRTLGLVLGPRIGLPLTTTFKQHETITSPDGATFVVNGSRTQDRIIAEGPLTTRSSVMVGFSGGLESFIQIDPQWAIIPAVSADYFFTSLVNDATWNTYGVRAEIGVRFSVKEKEAPPPPPPPPPPVIAFAPVSVVIAAPLFTGEVVTGNQLNATTPVVNAVFFDSASASIPASYRRTDDGSIPPSDPVEAHQWLLPRMARIMKANPDASLLLEGAGGLAGESATGKQRAENVKAALVGMGISQQRISVKGVDLPRPPSNAEFAGGREENHRVDLVLSNAPLQEWVSAERFAELHGNLSAEVSRAGGNPELATGAVVTAYLEGEDSSRVSTIGATDTVKLPVLKQLDLGQDSVNLVLTAQTEGAVSQKTISVHLNELQRRSIELEASGFMAILRFEYNSAELSADVKLLLSQLVQKLPSGSVIHIGGSADVLGTAERNRQLSEERASNTEDYINSVAKGKVKVEAGTMADKFSDDTPQGRFLNRCIRVTVITP
jgi:outer membrane protein OmpA-like peptidoglycan-associated protein